MNTNGEAFNRDFSHRKVFVNELALLEVPLPALNGQFDHPGRAAAVHGPGGHRRRHDHPRRRPRDR